MSFVTDTLVLRVVKVEACPFLLFFFFLFLFFKAVISYLLPWIMPNFCIAWFGGRSISGFPHGNGILHQEFQLILFLDKQLILCSFQHEVKKQGLI